MVPNAEEHLRRLTGLAERQKTEVIQPRAESEKQAVRAQQAQAAQEAELFKQEAGRAEVRAAANELAEFERQNAIKNAEADIAHARAHVRSVQFDPNRAFPTTIAKIGAIISVALGTFAQGLSGGRMPNVALEIMNKAIERDIDAQKFEYEKRRGMVSDANNVYAQMMQKHGDERRAALQAESAAREAFRFKLESLQATGKLSEKNTQALMQAIDAKMSEADIAAQQSLETYGFGVRMDQARLRMTEAAALSQGAAADEKLSNPEQNRIVAMGEAEASWMKMDSMLKELDKSWAITRAFQGSTVGQWFGSSAASEFNLASARALQQLGEASKGAASDEDSKRFAAILPDAGQSMEVLISRTKAVKDHIDIAKSVLLGTMSEGAAKKAFRAWNDMYTVLEQKGIKSAQAMDIASRNMKEEIQTLKER